MAQLQPHALALDAADQREAKCALRLEPRGIEAQARALQIGKHAKEILPHEMLQHEAVVQRRAPAHAGALLRLAREPRDQRADEQLLRQRHARLRRHLEGAEFDEAEPAHRAVG